MIETAVGSLISQLVKSGYEKWIQGYRGKLELTDEAKAALKEMQKAEGFCRFKNTTGLGQDTETFMDVNAGATVSLSGRVQQELEAKGLIEFKPDLSDGLEMDMMLTHLGWILNPDTGKIDKVG